MKKEDKDDIENKNKYSLENKIISGLFIFFIVFGIILTTFNLTGNIVGTSETGHSFIGVVLFLLGLSGFFVYNKLNENYCFSNKSSFLFSSFSREGISFS